MKYTSLTESGIRLSVEPVDRGTQFAADDLFMFDFAYRIEMQNLRQESVRLLRRKWTIYDALAPVHRVSGEGVVGETPLLEPAERYTYSSGCSLVSGIGSMVGYYVFVSLGIDGKPLGAPFQVEIPRFQLLAAPLWN